MFAGTARTPLKRSSKAARRITFTILTVWLVGPFALRVVTWILPEPDAESGEGLLFVLAMLALTIFVISAAGVWVARLRPGVEHGQAVSALTDITLGTAMAGGLTLWLGLFRILCKVWGVGPEWSSVRPDPWREAFLNLGYFVLYSAIIGALAGIAAWMLRLASELAKRRFARPAEQR